MSTVIKARASGPILKRLSTVDLADHLAEARAVVEAAQRRAAQIIAEAEVQAESVLEEARESGHDAGYKQGYAEGTSAGHQTARDESIKQFKQEHGNIVADFQRAISEIDSMKQDLQIQAEKGLLDFAVLVATKLTFMIGRIHRESAVENVKRAIRLVGSKSDVTIRIHSRDISAMEMFADSAIRRADASRVVSIVTDDSIAPGGCKVESGCTNVDATLETQVDEIVSLLIGGEADNA